MKKKLLRFNLILTAIIAVIACSSFVSANSEIAYIRDMEYCNIYYSYEYGTITGVFICYSGLCFNPEFEWCEWPEMVHETDKWGYVINHNPFGGNTGN